jgi:hypothetical protein
MIAPVAQEINCFPEAYKIQELKVTVRTGPQNINYHINETK